MDIPIEKHGEFTVFRPCGRLGLTEVETLAGTFAPSLVEKKPMLALDLSGVDFLGSRALGFLLQVRSEVAQRGGRFVLLSPSHPIQKILAMSHLDGILEVIHRQEGFARRGEAASGEAGKPPNASEQREQRI